MSKGGLGESKPGRQGGQVDVFAETLSNPGFGSEKQSFRPRGKIIAATM